jgi:hypothetical protein
MEQAMQVELNEANLKNMCGTKLVTGFHDAGGYEEIVMLAKALGIYGITNPENDAYHRSVILPHANQAQFTADQLLDRIQDTLGFPINLPPFTGNYVKGFSTKYGIIGRRFVFYLWLLKRILELCPEPHSGIIEIGAGFGVLGYFLDKLGYKDYTTIDLALVNACQTYFLAKNLPDRNIILSGDVQNPFDPKYKDSIKLLHSTDFHDVPKNRFAIMVNMDGLTEYGIQEASKYVQSDCAPMLLSINHEVNAYRVCEIPQPNRNMKYRYPFWLRGGYVEELYVNR